MKSSEFNHDNATLMPCLKIEHEKGVPIPPHASLFVELFTLYLTISVFISSISPFGKSNPTE